MKSVAAADRGFAKAILEQLRCPYCASSLRIEEQLEGSENELRYGVVRCACRRYPVVEGIPVIRQLGPLSSGPVEAAVADLAAGNPARALGRLVEAKARSPGRRMVNLAGRVHAPFARAVLERMNDRRASRLLHSGSFASAVRALQPASYADYLVHRYANPSYLAAIPVLTLLGSMRPEPPAHRVVVDLACGAGHSSDLIGCLFPDLTVIAVDQDFSNLFLARRYLHASGACLCLDADVPLPFQDGSVDAVFCLDAFHYICSKVALVRELRRVLSAEGMWLFPHLHNALRDNYTAGVPLEADDYRRVLEVADGRLFAEHRVLDQFMTERTLDLEGQPDEKELEEAPVFTFVASKSRGFWRRHEALDAIYHCGIRSPLTVNPVYRAYPGDQAWRLRMTWPNRVLENECLAVERYLPAELDVDASLLARVHAGKTDEGDASDVERLFRDFVLVPLPAEYLPGRAE